MEIYRYDDALRKKGFSIVAGIDEAGRGPLAGPVVAAAVVFSVIIKIEGLRDSKKVPEKERNRLFWDILSAAAHIGVGIVGNTEIDKLNIVQATKLAMREAVEDLSVVPDLLVIDAVTLPSLPISQISPIKAESKSASVAAASIIAKYVRDSIMSHYHDVFPQYNFRKHKGYCTQEHMSLLQKYGPCEIHRKSFEKVMSLGLPFQN